MRSKLTITLICNLFVITSCHAQKLTTFSQPEVQAKKETYVVEMDKGPMKKLKFVHNKNNKFQHIGMNPPKYALTYTKKDQYVDEQKITQICLAVFTKKRIEQLSKDTKDLLITMATNHQGTVIDIRFAFDQNSSISPEEIENLESRLKSEIHATINEKIFKDYRYIAITRFVDFNKLLTELSPDVN